MEDRGLNLMNSKYGLYAKEQDSARQQALVSAQIPYYLQGANKEQAYAEYLRSGKGGKGADITPSPTEIKSAGEIADKRLMELVMQNKIKPNSPEYSRMRDDLIRNILAQSGKVYTPLELSNPLIRGTQQAPLGAR